MFIHTLDMIPRNWYTLLELRHGTAVWDELANSFKNTFIYVDESPLIDATLQVIKEEIFKDIFVPVSILLQWIVTV